MATRSRIGLMLEDGTIMHSYCHWDGYPTGVGQTLVMHYSDVDKIKELLSFGDMSFLAPNLNPVGVHSFDNPENGVTVFYKRDRGETGSVDSVVTTLDEYQSVKYSSYIDFLYLFKDGKWFVSNTCNDKGWQLVKKYLAGYDLTDDDISCTM